MEKGEDPLVMGTNGRVVLYQHRGKEDVRYRPRFGAGEGPLRDAHDLIHLIARPEGPPNHFRILCKAPLPIVVREYGVGVRARCEIVVFCEYAPERGANAERMEHPPRDVLLIRLLRFVIRTRGKVAS